MNEPEAVSHVFSEIPAPTRLYGKYRGTVDDNSDPMMLGRIMATVPDVGSQTPLSWAMPCAPFPGAGAPSLAVPPIGASVWIEFEQGDPNYPIWSGGYWSAGQTPLLQIPGAR
jgi:hypothetical protein